MNRKYCVVTAAFLACIAASWNIADCAAAPIKINVLTAGIGQKDANLPEDIVKFCKPIVVEGDSLIPDVEFHRVDLAEKKSFEIKVPSSWTDNFFKPDPKLIARKKCEALPQLTITEDFSNNINSDFQQIEPRKKEICNGLITFEIAENSPTEDIHQKLQKQIEQDIQKNAQLNYCVFYKLKGAEKAAVIMPPQPPVPPPGGDTHYDIVPPSPANQDMFGIIEIGASGIKPAVLQMVEVPDEDRYNVEERNIDAVKNKYEIITMGPDDRSAFHPDAIKYVAEDVKNYVDKFQTSYAVPIEHIYIVGSSSVAKVEHKEELKQAIHDKTRLAMDFVTAEQESKHVFNGVLKLIPKKRNQRDKREQEVVVIDIGSGNIKGGYYDSGANQIVTFELPFLGTKTFSKKVDQERRDAGFKETAQDLRTQIVQPAIRNEANRVPGLKNKPRVYLVGGIVWATSSLLSLDAPEYAKRSATGDQEVYTVMNFDGFSDVDRLYNRLVGNNAAEQVFTNNRSYETMPDDKKEKRRRDIERIRDGVFTVNQLIGGLELLKALSLELEFNKRHVFFIQNTLYAWPLGYVREKIERQNQ